MGFREIIKWLFIFVFGSLIVSFLIYPQSFNSFRENIGELIPSSPTGYATQSENPKANIVRLVPSEMEEYFGLEQFHKSCAYIEAIGESEGIYNMKQKVCREACGKRNMEYHSNDCEIDLFVCYCVQ